MRIRRMRRHGGEYIWHLSLAEDGCAMDELGRGIGNHRSFRVGKKEREKPSTRTEIDNVILGMVNGLGQMESQHRRGVVR